MYGRCIVNAVSCCVGMSGPYSWCLQQHPTPLKVSLTDSTHSAMALLPLFSIFFSKIKTCSGLKFDTKGLKKNLRRVIHCHRAGTLDRDDTLKNCRVLKKIKLNFRMHGKMCTVLFLYILAQQYASFGSVYQFIILF